MIELGDVIETKCGERYLVIKFSNETICISSCGYVRLDSFNSDLENILHHDYDIVKIYRPHTLRLGSGLNKFLTELVKKSCDLIWERI